MIDLHTIVRIIIKLFGMVLVVYGVVATAVSLPLLLAQSDASGFYGDLWHVTPMLAPFVLGTFLWLFPATAANTIIQRDPAPEAGILTKYELERICVSLMGLYLFYRAISDLTYQIALYGAGSKVRNEYGLAYDTTPIIVILVVELSFSLLLMLQARGIVDLLRKLRSW